MTQGYAPIFVIAVSSVLSNSFIFLINICLAFTKDGPGQRDVLLLVVLVVM
jgi:hypothetical protein